ncbi:MAG: zf-HC2 domain-containing protein, partial [Polyangiaceae bacterium]
TDRSVIPKVADLHPEDLLERDALGGLDEAERARLEAHLARCSTCRFERQLRADFADELEAGGPGVSVASLSPPRARAWPRSRTARALWLPAAAALLLVAGGAAAAIGLGGARWLARVSQPTGVPALSAEGAQGAARSSAHRSSPHATGPLPQDATESERTIDLPSKASVQIEGARPRQAAHKPMARETASTVAEPSEAARMFDAETEARRHGDYPRVLAIHRELLQRFGASREAQVSRATIGHLLLDRGDPAGALASFNAYFAAGSCALAEEAMIGRATALDHLGDAGEAASAWRALLAAFPDTSYAAHAQARIQGRGN